MDLTAITVSPGLIPYLPGVQLTHMPPHAVSEITFFVSGFKSVGESFPIGVILSAIIRFIVRTMTVRVWLLNIFVANFRC